MYHIPGGLPWTGQRSLAEPNPDYALRFRTRDPEELRRLPRAGARRPLAGPGVLAALAKQEVAKVLIHIAENPRTTGATLAELASHPSGAVRAAVAENRSCPRDVLARLAGDEDVDVRYSMAENHHLAQEILEILAEDSNPFVAVRARRTLSRIQQAAPSRLMPPDSELRNRAAK